MAVIYCAGDLFHRPPELLAIGHGCNCAGAMGKGIAVAFKREFPAMYRAYRAACSDGRLVPGTVFPWRDGDVWVYNLGTQRTWRTKARLGDVESAIDAMMAHGLAHDVEAIGLPRVGAGLGGIPWDDVRSMLTSRFANHAIDLVVVGQYRAGLSPRSMDHSGVLRSAFGTSLVEGEPPRCPTAGGHRSP